MLKRALKTGSSVRAHSTGTERSTRDLILDAAEELLQRRSYNAFSYQHIAVQLGIRNAAIHYHFPSKADLGTALIRRYRQRYQETIQRLESECRDCWGLLQGFFSIYRAYLEAGDMVCPGGVLGATRPVHGEGGVFTGDSR